MCGIMGYTGNRPAKNIIYSGLKRMEYRGYDSAGISILDNKVHTTRAVGDTSNLDLKLLPSKPTWGIGHTRWATHGKPSVDNAHPHTFGKITLVHNGIIENYQELKDQIDSSKLHSQTDSEVLAAYIALFYTKTKDLLDATQQALPKVQGTFGICVVSPDSPSNIVAARRGSPLLIGVDEGQYFVASDPSAIVDYTSKVIYLEDNQIALISPSELDIYDLKLKHQDTVIKKLENVDRESNKSK